MKYQIRTLLSALAFLLLSACGGGHPSANTSSSSTPSTTPTTVNHNPPATISFTSATPGVIGLQGSGQTTTSNLVFTVTDSNGAAVADGVTVDFTITSLNGGEYIGPNDNTPTQAVSQTSGGKGQVSIGLTSGTVAGTVIVDAVVDGTNISTESSKISMGGGVVDTAHFSLSTSKINLAGMVVDNDTATIQALLADRYGNYNVLEGTPVKFYAEAGAIDTSNITDKNGVTKVTFRTQSPRPYDGPDFVITPQEKAKIDNLNTTYGLAIPDDGSVLQRREWVTILATVPGEENFDDKNANGIYDAGDVFDAANDDLSDPYIDQNDNGQWDSSDNEKFFNTQNNGTFTYPNGVWDGPNCPDAGCQSGKTIWKSIDLMFTGDAYYCAIAGDTTIAAGQTGHYKFMVGDKELNSLVAGTTITVTSTAGTLSGDTNYTVPDTLGGPTEISFTLLNDHSGVTATITAKVKGPQVGTYTIQGCPSNQNTSLDVVMQ